MKSPGPYRRIFSQFSHISLYVGGHVMNYRPQWIGAGSSHYTFCNQQRKSADSKYRNSEMNIYHLPPLDFAIFGNLTLSTTQYPSMISILISSIHNSPSYSLSLCINPGQSHPHRYLSSSSIISWLKLLIGLHLYDSVRWKGAVIEFDNEG